MIPVSLLSVALTLCALAVIPKSEALFSKMTIEEETEHCYALNHNPYLGFATRTSYEEVYNKGGITPLTECKAVQMWMVIRHGTRYPMEEEMPNFDVSKKLKEQVLQNHKNKKGSLCESDIASLEKYNVQLDPKMTFQLTHQGRKDLYYLGQRMRRSFPDIFAESTYTKEQFQFRFTPTPRTKESAEYFYRGVFGMSFHSEAQPLPDPIKDLIYIYSECPGWAAETAKNKVHRANFAKGEHMKKVIEGVSRRLGFEEELSLDKIKIIYNECRYYKSWNVDKKSPWCAAFTNDELMTLEYEEDLKYYYKSGPGHPWNRRLSCPLVKDMYNHFSDKAANIKEKQMPKAFFYFSHLTLINQLSAGMGLTDDKDPITEDNFLQKANRNFRTTNFIPFTANILAVLYKCKNGPDKTVTKVRFYQSEHVVEYPGCSSGICKWEFIKKKFNAYVNDPICTDMSICTDEITKPKSTREMIIQAVKDNFTAIVGQFNLLTIIVILSLIIVVPMAICGTRLLR